MTTTTLTTSAMLLDLAAKYEALTAPDIHLDGAMQRALKEPLATFLGKPEPYPGAVVTTSAYWDKAKVYHPGAGWRSAMQELIPGNHPACVAGWEHYNDQGGTDGGTYGQGPTLEIAYCASLCRVWAAILKAAGR